MDMFVQNHVFRLDENECWNTGVEYMPLIVFRTRKKQGTGTPHHAGTVADVVMGIANVVYEMVSHIVF